MKPASCAICKKPLKEGDRVFHDSTKTEKNSLAHEKCWVDLRTGRSYAKKKKKREGTKSKVPLDPPF